MAAEGRVDGAAQRAFALAVDDAHRRHSLLRRPLDVLGDDVRDLARREGVQIQLFSGDGGDRFGIRLVLQLVVLSLPILIGTSLRRCLRIRVAAPARRLGPSPQPRDPSQHARYPGQWPEVGAKAITLARSAGGSLRSRIWWTSAGVYSCEKCMSTRCSLWN